MKNNTLYILAALFLMLACKNKPETESITKAEKAAKNTYLKDVVGVAKNGDFVVNNPDTIKKYWNNKLRTENIAGLLSEIEVVKAKPNDTTGVIHILVAKSDDKKTKVSAFLVLKEDKLYFEIEDKTLNLSICQGCIDGCNPGVSVHDGVKSIVCSPCLECMKGDIEVY